MRPIFSRLVKDALASTYGAAVGIVRPPAKRFMIFTNGRTGSNWLVSLLRDHPEIRVHSEIFGEHQIKHAAIRKLITKRGPAPYLASCFRRMTTENYVCIKMLYYNIDEDYGLKHGLTGLSSLRSAIFEDPGLAFIHLRRLNHVERLISNALATASGRFLNGKYPDQKIEIDLTWARSELDRMVEWEKQFDAALPKARTFKTSYEDLVADPGEVMTSIFEFLG